LVKKSNMKNPNGMIIVKIHGGLGNQMFQYALGQNLSLLHGVPFKIDSSYLSKPNQSNRSLGLHHFQTKMLEATPGEIAAYQSPFQKILDRAKPYSQKKNIVERSNTFDPDILKRQDGFFIGYWNTEKYFKNNEQAIRNDFKLAKPFGSAAENMRVKIASEPNSASLHIRRGDYVSIEKVAQVLGALPLSYYEKAMSEILAKNPNVHFFIFSDDINWAKENLKNNNMTFVSSPDIPDYEELVLQSLCLHNIIANSTFSWWGAWLNENPQKIVIAPKKWFADDSKNTADLIPSTWILI